MFDGESFEFGATTTATGLLTDFPLAVPFEGDEMRDASSFSLSESRSSGEENSRGGFFPFVLYPYRCTTIVKDEATSGDGPIGVNDLAPTPIHNHVLSVPGR